MSPLDPWAAEAEARTCLTFDAGMSLRQRRILRSALRMFAEREYAEVSLRDIAREAGVSLTLIDHHFGAKHALFTAVVQSWSAIFADAAREMRHAQAQGRVADAGDLVDLMLRPIGLLLGDPDGRPVLRLWARHRLSPDAAISGPMDLAIGPFRDAIERGLEKLYPGSTAPDRHHATSLAIAATLEFTADSFGTDLARPLAGQPATRLMLQRHITGGWQASLDAPDASTRIASLEAQASTVLGAPVPADRSSTVP
jgi:AcrR family transcriptional regulator